MSLLRQDADDATSFEASKAFDFVVQEAQLVRDGYGGWNLFIGASARCCVDDRRIFLKIKNHDGVE